MYILRKNVFKSRHKEVLEMYGQNGGCFYPHVAAAKLVRVVPGPKTNFPFPRGVSFMVAAARQIAFSRQKTAYN
jgi:hypothetical protein